MLKEIIIISIICYVIFVLTQPEMIFHFYWKLIDKLPDWLYKPLGGCLVCFSGQVSFWFFLITHFKTYNPFYHIFFVCAVIFAVLIYDKLIDYGTENY